MEEENKKQDASEDKSQHQHVRIFGAEVNTGGDQGSTTGATKDEWRARKEEWKAKHQEHREQWRARRKEWHQDRPHTGGFFGGLIVLLAGVLALLYTMGFVSPVFWRVIIPFWPILLILWGASIVLGQHWFARFVLFLLALAFLIAVIIYGLVRADSPLVSSLSPTVVAAIQSSNPRY